MIAFRINEYCRQSNRKLSERFSLDISGCFPTYYREFSKEFRIKLRTFQLLFVEIPIRLSCFDAMCQLVYFKWISIAKEYPVIILFLLVSTEQETTVTVSITFKCIQINLITAHASRVPTASLMSWNPRDVADHNLSTAVVLVSNLTIH